MPFTRRDFFRRGTLFVAMGVTAPTFLTRTAQVMAETNDAALTGSNASRILVVIQFGGGNDGLNTVVPYGDQLYYKARPRLGVAQKDVLHITDQIGLNPNLAAVKSLYDAGHVAIVQGVGYPNPNRSHFRSTDIWTSGRPDTNEPTGWLGRYLDAECCGEDKPLTAIDVEDTVSPLFWTGHTIVPAIHSIQDFGFRTDTRFPNDRTNRVDTLKVLNDGSSGQAAQDYVRKAALDALAIADQMAKIAVSYKSTAKYPENQFATDLQTIAKLIQADLGTRIFHVTLGGFDTHSNEADRHNSLLKTASEGIQAFMQDLEAMGKADDVLMMTFSEFGRRVVENASGGTDHGEAAPLFIIGGGVKHGIVGSNPDLVNLDNGDVKFTVDFRAVYTTMIRDWLGSDPANVIGPGSFPSLGVVAAPATAAPVAALLPNPPQPAVAAR